MKRRQKKDRDSLEKEWRRQSKALHGGETIEHDEVEDDQVGERAVYRLSLSLYVRDDDHISQLAIAIGQPCISNGNSSRRHQLPPVSLPINATLWLLASLAAPWHSQSQALPEAIFPVRAAHSAPKLIQTVQQVTPSAVCIGLQVHLHSLPVWINAIAFRFLKSSPFLGELSQCQIADRCRHYFWTFLPFLFSRSAPISLSPARTPSFAIDSSSVCAFCALLFNKFTARRNGAQWFCFAILSIMELYART